MIIVKNLYGLIRNAFYASERDKIQDRFDHFDERIDELEMKVAVLEQKLDSIKEVFSSHLESVEQSVNAVRSAQGSLDLVSNARFSYLDDTLKELKGLIRGLSK